MHLLTPLLRAAAPYIGLDPVIMVVIVGLTVWTIFSGFRLRRAATSLRRRLEEAAAVLQPVPDAPAFAKDYETLSTRLEAIPLIDTPWRGYKNSLIVPTLPGRLVTATAEPRTWFDLAALFRDAGADLRYHAALPGLLVGAGLLYTFLGLAAALSLAGDVVQSGSDHARTVALHDLLGAASAKFITSVCGLFLSISYALFRKRALNKVESTFDRFLTRLRQLVPFKTSAFLQNTANELLEQQVTEFQQFVSEFATNLGQAFERSLDSELGTHVGPLGAAIDRLATGLANQNEEAVGAMLRSFTERLEGVVGQSMRATTATLEQLGGRLDGLQSGLDGAAQRMSKAAEEMATGLGRGMDTALADMAGSMRDLVASLRRAAEETSVNNRAASDDAARNLKQAASSLAEAVAAFRQQMEETAAGSVSRLSDPIESLVGRLRQLGEQQRETGSQASEALIATIGRAAGSLEATASRMAEALGGGAADASSRLVAASEAMRNDLRAVLEQFGAALNQSGSAMVDSADRGGRALAGAAATAGQELMAIATQLRDAGADAGAALRDGGLEARSGMVEAAATMARGSDGLGRQIAELGQAAMALVQQIEVLRVSARSASDPLETSAANLRRASETMREAADPLAETVRAVRLAMEGLDRTSSMFEQAQTRSGELAGRLAAASDRFGGLDTSIARTIDALGEGVSEISSRLTGFVVDVDRGLGQSVKGLTGIANGLDERLSDLNDNLERMRRE